MKLLNNPSVTTKSLISTLIGTVMLISLAGLATFSLLEVEYTIHAADTAVTLQAAARVVGADAYAR